MQPHSGGKDEELLFTCSTVVVLNADSDSDVAPLVIAADHNTYMDQMPSWFTLASTFVSTYLEISVSTIFSNVFW